MYYLNLKFKNNITIQCIYDILEFFLSHNNFYSILLFFTKDIFPAARINSL